MAALLNKSGRHWQAGLGWITSWLLHKPLKHYCKIGSIVIINHHTVDLLDCGIKFDNRCSLYLADLGLFCWKLPITVITTVRLLYYHRDICTVGAVDYHMYVLIVYNAQHTCITPTVLLKQTTPIGNFGKIRCPCL